MKIYVSGPPVDKIEYGKELHVVIYRTIKKLTEGKHDVMLPIKTNKLSKLSDQAFYREMSRRINEADGLISVFVEGDRSTPVEATIASAKDKPQSILEVGSAPRLIRGLPGIVEVMAVSPDKVQDQVNSVLENLIRLIEPEPEPQPIAF
jgi:hypothetical protein